MRHKKGWKSLGTKMRKSLWGTLNINFLLLFLFFYKLHTDTTISNKATLPVARIFFCFVLSQIPVLVPFNDICISLEKLVHFVLICLLKLFWHKALIAVASFIHGFNLLVSDVMILSSSQSVPDVMFLHIMNMTLAIFVFPTYCNVCVLWMFKYTYIFQEVTTESCNPKLFHVSPHHDFGRWRALGMICSSLHPLGVIQSVSCLFVTWWGIKMKLKGHVANWNMPVMFLVIPPFSPFSLSTSLPTQSLR